MPTASSTTGPSASAASPTRRRRRSLRHVGGPCVVDRAERRSRSAGGLATRPAAMGFHGWAGRASGSCLRPSSRRPCSPARNIGDQFSNRELDPLWGAGLLHARGRSPRRVDARAAARALAGGRAGHAGALELGAAFGRRAAPSSSSTPASASCSSRSRYPSPRCCSPSPNDRSRQAPAQSPRRSSHSPASSSCPGRPCGSPSHCRPCSPPSGVPSASRRPPSSCAGSRPCIH